ncbi:MAG: hypothetical protein AAGG44_06880 [Planctomycetota bacterium]
MYLLTAAKLPGQRFFEGQVYRFGRTSYRLFHRDMRVLRLVAEIASDSDQDRRAVWLLKYRRQLKALRHLAVGPALSLAATTTTDRRICLTALFLRSLVTGTTGANELLELGLKNDLQVRRRVAQTLFRIGAWAQLRTLLDRSPELSSVLPEAHARNRRPFEERSSQFFARLRANHSDQASIVTAEHTETCCPVFVTGGNFSDGKPAKPRWLIRLVLDRVRLRVSNKRSVDRLPKQFEYRDLG